jgi:hypothetical protein
MVKARSGRGLCLRASFSRLICNDTPPINEIILEPRGLLILHAARYRCYSITRVSGTIRGTSYGK